MAEANFTPLGQESAPPAGAPAPGGDGFQPLTEQQVKMMTGPAPTMEMVKEAPAKRPEKTWMRTIGEGILPTVGAVGGGMAGGLLTSPSVMGVPAGVLGGEMIGSALGEELNQVFGITEKSAGAVVGSGLAAPIGRAALPLVKGAASGIVKNIAGRDMMAQAARRLLDKMMGGRVAEGLFQQARGLNFFVPAIRTPQTIDRVLTAEVRAAPTEIRDSIIEAIAPLRRYYAQSHGTINAFHVNDLINEEQRLRELADGAFKSGQNFLGRAINSVRGAMLDDLEVSGAGVVKAATRAYRKEMALNEVENLLGKPHPEIKISEWLTKDALHSKAFSKPELDQIDRIAAKMAHVSASGGSGVFGTAIRGVGGYEAGGWWGSLIALAGPGAIRKLLGTQFGRNYTERILGASPKLSNEALMALAVFARGMTGRPPKEEEANAGAGQ